MRGGNDTPRQNILVFIFAWETGQGARFCRFFKFFTYGGVECLTRKLRIDVGIDKIKDYLMSRIDQTNPVEVEKVGRYLKHIEIYRRMDRTIKKEGVSVTTKNGSQTFIKAHPLLREMNRVNSAIINIEQSFNLEDGNKKFSAKDLI